MNLLKPGSFVTIQQRTGAADALGQPVETWENVGQMFADLRHLKGLESLRTGADTSIVRASARIRYRPGITAGMRMLWNNWVYDILAVLPQGERNQFLDLICARVGEAQLGD